MKNTITAVDLFCGNKGEVVKQIGNAVPGLTAKALCRELIA